MFPSFWKTKKFSWKDYFIILVIGGAEIKIGKKELKINDEYLYNYDILKVGRTIEYKLQGDSKSIIFRIALSIYDTYDIYVRAIEEYNGKLYVLVDIKKIRKENIILQP